VACGGTRSKTTNPNISTMLIIHDLINNGSALSEEAIPEL